MSGLFQDVRHAVRQLRKNRGFTAVAVITLALGIGANTAIFTLIHELLLKSLPVRDPQNLVAFGQQYGGGINEGTDSGALDLFPYDFYKQIESQHDAFDGIAAYASFVSGLNVRQSGIPMRPATQVTGHLVSGNFFGVLGASTVLGRTIVPSDATTPGSTPVAVISYQYWQREFAADGDVIGKSLVMNGTPFTVIGVAAPTFYGVELDQNSPDIWLPLTMQKQVMLQESLLDPHGLYFLHLMGRRKPGMKLDPIREWVNLQLRNYLTAREGANLTPTRSQEIQKIFVELMPGGRGISNLRVDYAEPLRILMGLVATVLLVACANLANFLLAKATSREREFSTRLALGASRARIVLHMLAESMVLALLGGAVGLLLASWGTRLLIDFVAAGDPHIPLNPNPDVQVLVFTLGLSWLTALLFGLAPALRVSRVGLTPGMGANARPAAGGETRATRFLPKLLVALQVALGLVLVVAAGLLARTLRNLEQQDFGFNRQNVLCVSIDSHNAGLKQEELGPLYQRILDRTQAVPGVLSAALSFVLPISDVGWGAPVSPKGYAAQPNEDMNTFVNGVSARYFETVGIPVLAGRAIGTQDVAGSTLVVVISQSLAEHFFPRGDALGHAVTFDQPDLKGEWKVIGIVKDTRNIGPRESPGRMAYLPTLQLTGGGAYAYWLELHTGDRPEYLGPAVHRALTGIDPNLPIGAIETVRQRMGLFTGKETLMSQLSIFFSLLALLLACIGLYGLMTYNVLRRTNEIGVRMALGAQTSGVLWLVLRESLVLLGIGIVVGVPASVVAARLLQSQLFGIKSSDPLTALVAVVTVAVTTLLAGYFPARRATRIDPMTALRYE